MLRETENDQTIPHLTIAQTQFSKKSDILEISREGEKCRYKFDCKWLEIDWNYDHSDLELTVKEAWFGAKQSLVFQVVYIVRLAIKRSHMRRGKERTSMTTANPPNTQVM